MSTLTVKLAEDAYQGDAQAQLSIDGVAYGSPFTVTAANSSGQSQTLTFAPALSAGKHTVAVTFLNDAYGKSASTDRNLYVQDISFDGTDVGGSKALYSTGASAQVTVNETAAAVAANTLVLNMSEDAYKGDAQFTVKVDGVQVGGTYAVTASHASGQSQAFTIGTALSSGSHSVAVTFLNDAYGGTSATDRNLYVTSATLNGTQVAGASSLYSTGSTDAFSVTVPSAASTTGTTGTSTTVTPATTTTTTPATTTTGTTTTTTSSGMQLVGVNLAGPEFNAGTVPGVDNVDYTYPTHSEIDYYASKGMDVIRVPFLWERMQPTENGALSSSQLSLMDDVVNYANSKGMKVILDDHNYGYGYGNEVGSSGTPNSAFADLWGKLASHYAGNSNVLFGLMNEPHDQTATQWAGSAQAAVTAIRSAGATSQEILVSGTDWDGAWTWVSSGNAQIMASNVTDPDHNMAFEVHQYLDADGSGTGTTVSSTSVGVDRLQAVTSWAQSTGNKLFLGEFGVSQDSTSLTAMNNMLSYMNSNSNVWQGATYWAGGPWWGSYAYSIEPSNGADKPQMAVLQKYAAG